MTTLRDHLNGKKRYVMSVILVGFTLCFVGVLLGVIVDSDANSLPWVFLWVLRSRLEPWFTVTRRFGAHPVKLELVIT